MRPASPGPTSPSTASPSDLSCCSLPTSSAPPGPGPARHHHRCPSPPHRVARRASWDGRHMASIRTAGLAKNFGDLRAVNEIDLDLPEGGVAGFVGPNGAGKSTTIRMLLGLITPTGGEGEVFGHPIGRPAAYLHRVGALIEAPAFYPALTGEANLTEYKKEGRSYTLRPDLSFAAPTRLVYFATETGAKPTPTRPRAPRRRSTRSVRSGG